MNRTLRRPMFRIGGVAEGITSGLDNPQLTASRQPYNRGRVVNPGGYAGDDEYDIKKNLKAMIDADLRETGVVNQGGYQGDPDLVGSALESLKDKRVQELIGGQRRPQWPQFLTSFGLDLLSRPPEGNIFQTAAAAAKGPYSQMMATRSERGAREDKLKAALFGEFLDVETRKYEAQKKVEAEAAGKTDKSFDPGQAAKIAKLRDDMYQKRLELETEKSQIEAIPENERSEEQKNRLIQIVQAELPSTEGTIADLEGAESTIEKINAAGQIDSFNDLIDEYEGDGMTYEEAFLAAIKFYEGIFSKVGKEREESAEGGRIGYQNAGSVMPNAMPNALPAAMQTQAPGPTDQDDTVQDLSFEELRARLPQEITNDIVKLLSESKQALVDFANIRTQQDVNAFNQKYDVNLVVPQEV